MKCITITCRTKELIGTTVFGFSFAAILVTTAHFLQVALG